ncbi:hypothetical protein [Nonomuraea sp. SYSU D8015]|uniref:hypothetical protein n=1 Tax=Nonomuraea sp. SYSU D8015 TaxID=2593644 RepID=UPI00166032B6|nr:hypothetical protein [Nonomuraea sp. SYSU D8015]
MGDDQRKFELSGPQILGGALASVTAAVAASYLGVAGTVIGAAVVSVASTIATAVYTHYLKRTGERVKQHALSGRRHEPEESSRRLPWVKIAAAAAVVFAVSMGSILVYQAAAQQTVHEQIVGKSPKKAGEADRASAERAPEEGDPPAYRPGKATERPATPTPSETGKPAPTKTPTPAPTQEDTVAPSPAPTTTAPVRAEEGRPDVAEQPPPTDQAEPTEDPAQDEQAEQTATPAP